MPGVAIEVSVGKNTATPALAAVAAALGPTRLNPIVGRSARNTIRGYLIKQDGVKPNQLGGTRTHFYLSAARATQFKAVGDHIVVSINQVGIRQRYYGGVIRPVTAKYLTIPVNPLAYGKRAREFDLELIFGQGGRPIALALKGQGIRYGDASKNRAGEIMFRLVKSVNQPADPTVLPPEGMVEEGVKRDVEEYLKIVANRAGFNGGAN